MGGGTSTAGVISGPEDLLPTIIAHEQLTLERDVPLLTMLRVL